MQCILNGKENTVFMENWATNTIKFAQWSRKKTQKSYYFLNRTMNKLNKLLII